MTGPILTAICTGLLLLWRLVLDYVPMYPLNDVTRKTVKSRKRDWTVHYIPLLLALLLSLSNSRLSTVLGLIILILYAAVQIITWWAPYIKGGTESQKAKWDSMYGKTHRFLPRISNHTVPDTSHVITGMLTLVVVGALAGQLWASPEAKEPSLPTAANQQEPAASGKPVPAPSIQTSFTQSAGQKPDQLLIQAIQGTKKNLDIAINAINHEEIVKEIIKARIAGADVRIITDRSESTNAAQAEKLKSLVASGIPVKVNSRSKGMMNLKLALFDDEAGATGSFNFTQNASTSNDEMLVILRDKTTVGQWKQQFDAMWNDTQNFKEFGK